MSGLLLVRVVKINHLIIRADSPPLISDRVSTHGMIWACVCVLNPVGIILCVCVCVRQRLINWEEATDWLRVGWAGGEGVPGVSD